MAVLKDKPWAQMTALERSEYQFRERYRSWAERSTHRLPASFQAHVMEGWAARYGVPFSKTNGSIVARANLFAIEQVRDFGAARVASAYDEEAIRDYAANYSLICCRLTSLPACRKFGKQFGIEPPTAPGMTEASERARWCEPMWWRRQLRRVWTRAAEDAMRRAGIIRKGRQPYASDEAVTHRAARAARTAEWLESRVMVNEAGEQLPLMDLHKRSLANPALRRGEFMCRMRGFEEIAQDLGHVALFWTLTTPSRFHAQRSAGGVNPAWETDRARVRDGQQWLRDHWARARAKLARLSILYYGFRVAEPHHDGTPHWHAILFTTRAASDVLQQVLRGIWLSEDGSEPGAAEHRAKCITIDAERGSAAGYIAKYVAKNIDGAGAIGDDISDETGERVSDGLARVAAWASCHGIRQFQQIGGPPVGLWRECRRARTAVTDPDIERARAAADGGAFRAFIYALSFEHIKAGRRVALKLERDEDIRTHYRSEAQGPADTGTGPVWREGMSAEAVSWGVNAYGEETRARIIGLRHCGAVVVTRPHRWRIEKKCANASTSVAGASAARAAAAHRNAAAGGGPLSDSSRASASRSSLGPVAITVRSAEGPSLSDPAGWICRETSTAGPEWLQ